MAILDLKRFLLVLALAGLGLSQPSRADGQPAAVSPSARSFHDVYEMCTPVETQSRPAIAYLSPGYVLILASGAKPPSRSLAGAKVEVLERPRAGAVTETGQVNPDAGPVFLYEADAVAPDGTEDRVVFLVESSGKRHQVIVRLILGFNSESIDCKGEPFYSRRLRTSPAKQPAPPARRGSP